MARSVCYLFLFFLGLFGARGMSVPATGPSPEGLGRVTR